MTERELKKLNRYQLLQLLTAQTERVEELEKLLELAKEQIHTKEIKMASLGSLAEVSLQLNDVFQNAQAAADMYVSAAQKRAEEIIADAWRQSAEILVKAEAEARLIRGE